MSLNPLHRLYAQASVHRLCEVAASGMAAALPVEQSSHAGHKVIFAISLGSDGNYDMRENV